MVAVASSLDSSSDEKEGIASWSRLCAEWGWQLSSPPPVNTITCGRAAEMSSLDSSPDSDVAKPHSTQYNVTWCMYKYVVTSRLIVQARC